MHLADPKMPETMANNLHDAGFVSVHAEPIMHIEMNYDPRIMSAIIAEFRCGICGLERFVAS